MNYELAFFDRMQCSRDQKKDFAEYIYYIRSFSEKARRMGLLAIEDDLSAIEDLMLRKGLQLVVDGTDPEIVSSILFTMIGSRSLKGSALLRAALTLEGVLAIQAGDNPGILAEKLSAFLGEDSDLWESYRDSRADEPPMFSIPEEEPVCRANASVGSLQFEQLADFSDISIQKIMRETDSQELCKALKGSSKKVRDRVFSNFSSRAEELIREDIIFMGPVRLEDVLSSQEKILTITLKLADMGEIIIPDGRELIE